MTLKLGDIARFKSTPDTVDDLHGVPCVIVSISSATAFVVVDRRQWAVALNNLEPWEPCPGERVVSPTEEPEVVVPERLKWVLICESKRHLIHAQSACQKCGEV